ncbi:MAG: hypothetical protein ACR5LA_09075, partial [Wolbachia sp.]
QSKIILLHFYSWVTSLLFDNMFPEFTLFSSLFYRFLIRNWGLKRRASSRPYNPVFIIQLAQCAHYSEVFWIPVLG